MFRLLGVIACAAVAFPAWAGEVAVKWKKEGQGYANENKLPAGAAVKLRVKYLDDNKTAQEFAVNGSKEKANKEGDEFRAKVDANGKVTVTWSIGPNQEDAAVVPLEGGGGTDLRFGHHKVNGVSRWKLVVNVKVEE